MALSPLLKKKKKSFSLPPPPNPRVLHINHRRLDVELRGFLLQLSREAFGGAHLGAEVDPKTSRAFFRFGGVWFVSFWFFLGLGLFLVFFFLFVFFWFGVWFVSWVFFLGFGSLGFVSFSWFLLVWHLVLGLVGLKGGGCFLGWFFWWLLVVCLVCF